jgi:WD40 repeat protein
VPWCHVTASQPFGCPATIGGSSAVCCGGCLCPALTRRPQYVTTGSDGSVRIWHADTHLQLSEVCQGSTSGKAGIATCAAFSPGADMLAVGFRDGAVRLYAGATSTLRQVRRH